jgi:hypothetical protein
MRVSLSFSRVTGVTRSTNPHRRPAAVSFAALIIAPLIMLTACGGGSSDGSDETDRDTAEREETEETAVVVTAAPVETAAVQPTTTPAPTTTEASVVTDPPPDTTGVADADFCTAAEDFFLPGRALDFGDVNDPVLLEGAFTVMNVLVFDPIELAPTADDAALFVESQRLLDIATPGLEAAGYDLADPTAIPNNEEVGQALIDFGGLLGEMQLFLVEKCGSDSAELDEIAMVLAVDLAAGTLPASVTFVEVTNDDLTITVDVPESWADVDGAPDTDVRQLAAAPDVATFLASYTEDGMIVVTGDAPIPDAWIAALDAFVGSAESSGCTIVSDEPYDDGVYTGTENLLDCGDPADDVRLIGGRDDEGSLFFLLAIVSPADSPEIRDTIVQTFLL